ncbi:hypothetical protein C8R46DRAFT_1357679 [Mycena filopes]|nr:hypothetical protein C8R46DRAFT_1357679 [Mycena filopes]
MRRGHMMLDRVFPSGTSASASPRIDLSASSTGNTESTALSDNFFAAKGVDVQEWRAGRQSTRAASTTPATPLPFRPSTRRARRAPYIVRPPWTLLVPDDPEQEEESESVIYNSSGDDATIHGEEEQSESQCQSDDSDAATEAEGSSTDAGEIELGWRPMRREGTIPDSLEAEIAARNKPTTVWPYVARMRIPATKGTVISGTILETPGKTEGEMAIGETTMDD